MEREPLGIRDAINSGLKNPSETAKTIARILVRDIWSEAHDHDTKNHWELSPLEQVALVALRLPGQCRQVAQKEVQASFVPSIELLVREFASQKINVTISGELQKMVAHAVLEILAVGIQKKGYGELAHSIHNESNALHLLRNPTRLLLLDYGIIHTNPREAASNEKQSSLWTGHRTDKSYKKNGAGHTNIYAEVTPEGKIIPVLEGNRIIQGLTDELIIFTDDTINFHGDPRLPTGADSGFVAPLRFSTSNTLGTFESISHRSVSKFVGWNTYVMVGKKGAEKTETQMVVCIRTKEGENNQSFSSNGKAYKLNNTIIVIENDGFHFLSQNGREKITAPIENIIGLKKAEGKEEALYVISNGGKKKITLKDETAELVDIDVNEEEFFEKKK